MMLVDCSENRCIERQELKILGRSLARRQKIHSRISHYRPVAMLSGTVHTVERLLVEDDLKMMFLSHFLHYNHEHHVLVDGFCSLTEHRSTFKLVGSHFIMPCLKKDTELICLSLKVLHERAHTRRNRTEIVVFQLLVLCRSMSDHCPACKHEVRTGIVKRLVYEEVFLLDAKVYLD